MHKFFMAQLQEEGEVLMELLLELFHHKRCRGLCNVNVVFIQISFSPRLQSLRFLHRYVKRIARRWTHHGRYVTKGCYSTPNFRKREKSLSEHYDRHVKRIARRWTHHGRYVTKGCYSTPNQRLAVDLSADNYINIYFIFIFVTLGNRQNSRQNIL